MKVAGAAVVARPDRRPAEGGVQIQQGAQGGLRAGPGVGERVRSGELTPLEGEPGAGREDSVHSAPVGA